MRPIIIDRKLYQGKPTDKNRMDKEMATYDLLDKLNIDYYRLDHEPTASIEDCNQVDSILGIEICKNLFLRNGPKSEFYLLVMPGYKKLVTKNVSKQIGSSRLSFAEDTYMEEFLNIKPGSVSILGLINDIDKKVQLLMDKEVMDSEYFGCHPCVNTSSLRIKTSDIFNKFLPYTGHRSIIVEL
ncbi:MAG: aminoacyl-tRNA synthetase [Peptococcaceae bacterium BICA1-8]|nr:MAG: aminoacyl-tRNA synthetase [Peptococcaceae bacterium BICA1-8]